MNFRIHGCISGIREIGRFILSLSLSKDLRSIRYSQRAFTTAYIEQQHGVLQIQPHTEG